VLLFVFFLLRESFRSFSFHAKILFFFSHDIPLFPFPLFLAIGKEFIAEEGEMALLFPFLPSFFYWRIFFLSFIAFSPLSFFFPFLSEREN